MNYLDITGHHDENNRFKKLTILQRPRQPERIRQATNFGMRHVGAPTGLKVVLLLGVASIASAASARVRLPQVKIDKIMLPNGLHALLVESHLSPVVNLEVWYHVGSKDERPGQTGFAHLFEHLMFDGTTNLGSDEFSNYIVRSGGLDNAYTTEDLSLIHI